MMQIAGSTLLIDLVRAGSTAVEADALYASTLPVLRSYAGAEAALLVVSHGEESTVAQTDGLALPSVHESAIVEGAVPEEWSRAGVVAIAVRVQPGHRGTLTLAWTTAPEAAALDAAGVGADVVTSAAERLDLDHRLRDLASRVDNAQQLAQMGDYDWHIPTDTNQWSDQLFRIYGHEPQSFNASYDRFLSAIHPEDRERIQAIHQEAYATGDPYRMIERIVRPDGQVRYLSSNGEVIMDDSGTPVRMRGTCIDITERLLAEAERERLSAVFRSLVEAAPEAILVSDADDVIVRANSTAVRLLHGDPSGRRLAEVLPRERQTGQAVPALTLDGRDLVLDVTCAELSTEDHERRTASFLTDAVPRLEREAMASRLGELHQRRRQALEINDNVVQGLSSVQYALDQGENEHAQALIARTLGAARNMMDDLLDPHGQSLGPGDLVRSRSAALDPVGGAEATTPAVEIAGVHDPSVPDPHRVLIVDDAEDIRMLLRLKLGAQDAYDVVGEAVDGVDAVEQARTLQPHLVLLDMAMPRMDGLQALPLIREAVPGVRVIVLSGFNQHTLEHEAMAAGADRYVVKGGPMNELMELIASVLDAA